MRRVTLRSAPPLTVCSRTVPTAHLKLVIEHTRFERRPLLGEQRVRRGDVWARNGSPEAEDAEVIFRVAFQVLLSSGTPDSRVGRHVDPGLGAVSSCEPRALTARHVSGLVELNGGLT
jgi:hypothetical protein